MFAPVVTVKADEPPNSSDAVMRIWTDTPYAKKTRCAGVPKRILTASRIVFARGARRFNSIPMMANSRICTEHCNDGQVPYASLDLRGAELTPAANQ